MQGVEVPLDYAGVIPEGFDTIRLPEAEYLLFQGPVDLHRKLKAQGIAIRNCDNYPGLTSGWYRIAVRRHEENKKLISAIGGVLGE